MSNSTNRQMSGGGGDMLECADTELSFKSFLGVRDGKYIAGK